MPILQGAAFRHKQRERDPGAVADGGWAGLWKEAASRQTSKKRTAAGEELSDLWLRVSACASDTDSIKS